MTIRSHDDEVTGDTPISMRAYAKLRGVNVSTVSRAIAAGKLDGALVEHEGEMKIKSAGVADELWARNTRPLPNRPPELPPERPALVRPIDVAGPTEAEATPDYFKSRAIREAALARKERAAAEVAELELAELQGIMVNATEMRAQVLEAYTQVKTHLLGVPTKFRQRCPHVHTKDVRELAALIREALEELAAEGDDQVEPTE